eukprot:TRINITY_DN549_c0_g1_i2.p1 TRINITY_DN549_c0_g1~~TRINITY_DN549_c0_g1_i2.p1  ORF type:complete len:221 (+),score=43.59 TRINITY_DN549_c0_g1_i2:134-796(+)
MLKLHADINPEEQIVGWYTTTSKKDSVANSVLFNDFYAKEMNNTPVMMIVDTTLKTQNWVLCYYFYPISLGERGIIQRQFKPLRHVLVTDQTDRAILKRVTHHNPECSTPLSDIDSLYRSLKELVMNLDIVLEYMRKVNAGEIQGNIKVAKIVDEILSCVPVSYSGSQSGGDVVSSSLQDILMCVYLGKLTKTHLSLAGGGVVGSNVIPGSSNVGSAVTD